MTTRKRLLIPLMFLITLFMTPTTPLSAGLFDDMISDAPVNEGTAQGTCAIRPQAVSECSDSNCTDSGCQGTTSSSSDDHSGCSDDHSGCSSPSTTGDTKEHDRCSGDDDGHDHSLHSHDHSSHSNSSLFGMSDEKRKASRCEHNKATADCRECSAAVGVVHISKEMTVSQDRDTESLIGLSTVTAIPVDDIVETIGQVSMPENDLAHISPRVNGTISKVFVNLGDTVEQNSPLFQLISTEIGQAAAAYQKAAALVRLARQELNRGKNMQKLRVTSDKEVYRLSYELEQADIEKTAARQELLILGISEKEIDGTASFQELTRGIVTVRAPMAGSITEKHAVIGEVVRPGETVLIIANLSRLWVWAKVYDNNIGLVLGNAESLKNKRASLSVAAFPNRTFQGTIDYVNPVMDPETRTLSLRLTVDNSKKNLLPGMFCRVTLPLGRHTVLAVPRYSVLSDGETDFVFVPFGENRFAAKQVQIGAIHGEHLPIIKGLKSGDQIVTRGSFILKSEVLKERMGAG